MGAMGVHWREWAATFYNHIFNEWDGNKDCINKLHSLQRLDMRGSIQKLATTDNHA